jgi:hypothetical protein
VTGEPIRVTQQQRCRAGVGPVALHPHHQAYCTRGRWPFPDRTDREKPGTVATLSTVGAEKGATTAVRAALRLDDARRR